MTKFKIGDRVMLPAKLVEFTKYVECGVDCAVVETDFGNSIIEGVNSLVPVDPAPGVAKLAEEYEALAISWQLGEQVVFACPYGDGLWFVSNHGRMFSLTPASTFDGAGAPAVVRVVKYRVAS